MLNYFIAEKYVRALDTLARAPNQKTFIMPMDMAGLAGSLAGIAELARSAGVSAAEAATTRAARTAGTVPPAGTPPITHG